MAELDIGRGLLGGILGGVAGYGKGLEGQGKAKRAAYLQQFEATKSFALEDRKHKNKLLEIKATGMLNSRKPSAIAPLLKEARALATGLDDNGIEKFDKPLYIDTLKSFGLGDIAAKLSKGGAATEFDPKLWELAAERADAETGDKAGFFSTDSTDFGPEGREGFKTKRTIAIYDQLGGRGRPEGSPGGKSPAPKTQEVRGENKPSGKTHSPAPQEVSQRVVGTTYKAPDGRLIEWTGKGWKLVGDGNKKDEARSRFPAR